MLLNILGEEILVTEFLPRFSKELLGKLAKTSYTFNNLCQNNIIYSIKVAKEFTEEQKPEAMTWFEFYKDLCSGSTISIHRKGEIVGSSLFNPNYLAISLKRLLPYLKENEIVAYMDIDKYPSYSFLHQSDGSFSQIDTGRNKDQKVERVVIFKDDSFVPPTDFDDSIDNYYIILTHLCSGNPPLYAIYFPSGRKPDYSIFYGYKSGMTKNYRVARKTDLRHATKSLIVKFLLMLNVSPPLIPDLIEVKSSFIDPYSSDDDDSETQYYHKWYQFDLFYLQTLLLDCLGKIGHLL